MSIDHTRYCESTLLFGLDRDSNGPLNRGVTLIIIVRVFGKEVMTKAPTRKSREGPLYMAG